MRDRATPKISQPVDAPPLRSVSSRCSLIVGRHDQAARASALASERER
jgi:hypothetical protein